ncbi:MAG: crossover junction endodeoxyribonuclease RuvC [Thermoleophilia bacterium]
MEPSRPPARLRAGIGTRPHRPPAGRAGGTSPSDLTSGAEWTRGHREPAAGPGSLSATGIPGQGPLGPRYRVRPGTPATRILPRTAIRTVPSRDRHPRRDSRHDPSEGIGSLGGVEAGPEERGRPPRSGGRGGAVVIGVDPGLASTGYAVLAGPPSRPRPVAVGTVRTSPRTPHPERLRTLHDSIAQLVGAHAVEAAAIESWFIHPMSRAAMAMAEARGAIIVALAIAGVEVVEYSPNTIKQSVTGSGRADKAQVRAMVARLTGAAPETDHAADALAAAICHMSSAPLRGAIRGAR